MQGPGIKLDGSIVTMDLHLHDGDMANILPTDVTKSGGGYEFRWVIPVTRAFRVLGYTVKISHWYERTDKYETSVVNGDTLSLSYHLKVNIG